MQLGKVQIVEGEAYKNQVESSQNETTSIPVPRGQIPRSRRESSR